MDKLLIIGAGRSATTLINYMLSQAETNQWMVTVADNKLELAKSKVNGHKRGEAIVLDVMDEAARRNLIAAHDIVVSMLPASLHLKVGQDCLDLGRHLLTASYVSKPMAELSEKAEEKGLIFMGELGLDPGIDHMSAMQHIDYFKSKNIAIKSFKSFTGGLIAPESDDNPWHYKFTWNPRNVILAGQGTAQYLYKDNLKYIPYTRLFESAEKVEILEEGEYEVYANRDSLLYRELYNLEEIPTIFRGTLRNVGFCDSWNAFVQLGLTDDTYPILHSDQITYRKLIDAFTNARMEGSVEEKVAQTLGVELDSDVMKNLEWTGIFSKEVIGLKKASPAQILQHLLMKKWKLKENDKDMIIMQHEFEYEVDGEERKFISRLKLIGESKEDTAMSKLVGLPLGILTKLVMNKEITSTKGIHIPVMIDVYEPVLEELEDYGIVFENHTEVLHGES